MKKDDGISILLSIVINIIIVILIPSLSTKRVENQKIKIGLVAYENKNRTKLDGQKNSNSSEKKSSQELQKKIKKTNEVKKVEEKKKEKTPNKSKDKIDMESLNNIVTNISAPKIEVIKNLQPNPSARKIKEIKAPTKEFAQKERMESNSNLSKDIVLAKEEIVTENEKLDLKEDDKIAFNSEVGKDESFDRILKITGETEGLPSGYRLGTEDGDIIAKWDGSNREPVYPESAQLKGLHGSVRIKMEIDESGNVKSLHLEKGSGVPEINNAIEEVGRTWKIYLNKNGLSVEGNVILEYNFILKGKID
ncbi:energy transducer TonB [Fusobacterium sp.]|uniref:energy transducer TonB n=1 Tax=Fusobacterium sp. TaxID=68766 RepID=UPI0025C5FBB3|nr:energy transducer TonB [Fusobacterium sp.]